MMKEIETEVQKSGMMATNGGELVLNFKGLKASDMINPSESQSLYCDIDKTSPSSVSGYDKLKKLIHRITEECLNRGLVTKEELGHSHINFDFASGQYTNRKLNLSLI